MSIFSGLAASGAASDATDSGASAIQGLIGQGQQALQGYYNQGKTDLSTAYNGAAANAGQYVNLAAGQFNPYQSLGSAAVTNAGTLTGTLSGANQQASSNIGVNRVADNSNPYSVESIGKGFTAATNPGYQFALGQGQQAINASSAAQGNLLSGANEKALDAYTTGYANQNFNNYVSQEQQGQAQNFANEETAYGNVMGQATTGLTAAGGASTAFNTGTNSATTLGTANMGDLTSLNTTGMNDVTSLYGSGISGTSSLYGADIGAQSSAFQSMGSFLNNPFGMFSGGAV